MPLIGAAQDDAVTATGRGPSRARSRPACRLVRWLGMAFTTERWALVLLQAQKNRAERVFPGILWPLPFVLFLGVWLADG
jgi:hypothetical protein